MKKNKKFILIFGISILCILFLFLISDKLINAILDKDTYVENEFGRPCYCNTLWVTTLNVSPPEMRVRAFLLNARILDEHIQIENANIRSFKIEFKIDKTAEELWKIRDDLSKKYWVGKVDFVEYPQAIPAKGSN